MALFAQGCRSQQAVPPLGVAGRPIAVSSRRPLAAEQHWQTALPLALAELSQGRTVIVYCRQCFHRGPLLAALLLRTLTGNCMKWCLDTIAEKREVWPGWTRRWPLASGRDYSLWKCQDWADSLDIHSAAVRPYMLDPDSAQSAPNRRGTRQARGSIGLMVAADCRPRIEPDLPDDLQTYLAHHALCSPADRDHNGWSVAHWLAEDLRTEGRGGFPSTWAGLIDRIPRGMLEVTTQGGRPRGRTALGLMCNGADNSMVRCRMVQRLLLAQADIDGIDHYGSSPLMRAVASGSEDIAMLLIQAINNAPCQREWPHGPGPRSQHWDPRGRPSSCVSHRFGGGHPTKDAHGSTCLCVWGYPCQRERSVAWWQPGKGEPPNHRCREPDSVRHGRETRRPTAAANDGALDGLRDMLVATGACAVGRVG